MSRCGLLVTASAAQLACGLAGLAVALARGHAYDLTWLRGRQDRIGRDSILMGTALSAPMTMLVAQAVLTVVVARQPSRRSLRALGVLGAVMVGGYLGEQLVRQRLRSSGWDSIESPLLIVAMGLAAAMGVTGLSTPACACTEKRR